MQQRQFADNFLIIMHLGVVKVGLLQLAKLEVINLRLILANKSMLNKLSSNFDNPYCHISFSVWK